MNEKYDAYYQLQECYFNISIPLLIVIRNKQLFVYGNNLISIIRIYFFKKFFKKLSLITKVSGIFMNFIWMMYNLSYLMFLICDNIFNEYFYVPSDFTPNNFLKFKTMFIFTKLFGIFIVFLIILGGAFEVLRALIEIMLFFRQIYHEIKLWIKKKNAIADSTR